MLYKRLVRVIFYFVTTLPILGDILKEIMKNSRASTVREWLHDNLKDTSTNHITSARAPKEMQPIKAAYPIPASLLLNAFENGTINKEN